MCLEVRKDHFFGPAFQVNFTYHCSLLGHRYLHFVGFERLLHIVQSCQHDLSG